MIVYFYVTAILPERKIYNIMNKDRFDRAARLAKRDAILKAMFVEMRQDNLPFMDCYQLLGDFFGLSDRQIRTLLNPRKSFLEVVSTDVSYFAVILQRISETDRKIQKEI